jgi:hypothetical protein
MSGPIVRKYGFPNFEKIFGERPLQHGVDEEAKSGEAPASPATGAGTQVEKPADSNKPSDPAQTKS